jgi:hypothetical protein
MGSFDNMPAELLTKESPAILVTAELGKYSPLTKRVAMPKASVQAARICNYNSQGRRGMKTR